MKAILFFLSISATIIKEKMDLHLIDNFTTRKITGLNSKYWKKILIVEMLSQLKQYLFLKHHA
jgi:hypothetical protein